MSDTPKTNAAICKRVHTPNVFGFKEHDRLNEFVSADFARNLEKEHDRLLAENKGLRAALGLLIPRAAHLAECVSVRPTEEWGKHGSMSFDNCTCGIAQARAAIAKAKGAA